MYNKNSTELESDKVRKNDDNKIGDSNDKGLSKFLIGTVTFAVFIVFMIVWMLISD